MQKKRMVGVFDSYHFFSMERVLPASSPEKIFGFFRGSPSGRHPFDIDGKEDKFSFSLYPFIIAHLT